MPATECPWIGYKVLCRKQMCQHALRAPPAQQFCSFKVGILAKRKEKRDKVASHCCDPQPADRGSTTHHRLRLEIVGCSSADPTAYPGHELSGRSDHLGANVVYQVQATSDQLSRREREQRTPKFCPLHANQGRRGPAEQVKGCNYPGGGSPWESITQA